MGFSSGKQALQQAPNGACHSTAEMYCQREKSLGNKAIKIYNALNWLSSKSHQIALGSFKKLRVTLNVQTGASYHRPDFWEKCSAFAHWKSRFFHKMLHVRQQKPLLNKVPQIPEIQESFMATYFPTKRKTCEQKNRCAEMAGSLQTCRWMQPVPAFTTKNFNYFLQAAHHFDLHNTICCSCWLRCSLNTSPFHHCTSQDFWKESQKEAFWTL